MAQIGRAGFMGVLSVLWRCGKLGKLYILISAVLLVGLVDIAPRYYRYISVRYGLTSTTVGPFALPQFIPEYSMVRYEGSLVHRQLEQCITSVRDSLRAAGEKLAANPPEGYEMLSLRPDLQITETEHPLDSAYTLCFLDARLGCDCPEPGSFRLVRFVVDMTSFRVSIFRDENINWQRYLGTKVPKVA